MSHSLLSRLQDSCGRQDKLIVLGGEISDAWTQTLIDVYRPRHRLYVDDCWANEPSRWIAAAMEARRKPRASMMVGPQVSMLDEWWQLSSSADATRAINTFDPERRATVIAPAHLHIGSFAGRPQLFQRYARFAAPELKVEVDAWFDAVGIRRPASLVATGGADELMSAWETRAFQGLRTVWSTDLGAGSFGGNGVVLVDASSAREAARWFAGIGGRVRMAQYVEGQPASVSALVDDHVTVPFPMMAATPVRFDGHHMSATDLRVAEEFEPGTIGQAKEAVTRFGDQLRTQLGFRGVFTIDGIVAPSKHFHAIETNMRPGVSIRELSAQSDIPLHLWHAGATTGVLQQDDIDWLREDLRHFERAILGREVPALSARSGQSLDDFFDATRSSDMLL